MKGYKHTELGWIPEDWELRQLGDIVKVTSGGTPSRNEARFWNGNIPWITTSQINFNEISTSEEFITQDGLANSSAKVFPVGTILMAMYGQGKTRGQVGILKINATTNQACAALLPNNSITPHYLFYNLSNRYQEIRNIGHGGNQVNLNGEIIKQILISFPSHKEQEKIVSILYTVDRLLITLSSLITQKQLLKKGLMQQLLTGKKRLKGFKGEWKIVTIGEIADPNERWSFTGGPFGSNLKSSEYTGDGVRIIQLQNIGDGVFYDDYKIFTSEQKANELLSCSIYPGEIIISKMGDPVARATIIPDHHNRYVMSSDGIRLLPDPKRFNTTFIVELINSQFFRRQAEDVSTGTTRKRIGLDILRKLKLTVPEIKEQNAIASIFSNINSEIITLEKQLHFYTLQKQGLMQQLLTGKKRVKQ